MHVPNRLTTRRPKIDAMTFFLTFRSLRSIIITGILGLVFLFIVVPSLFRWSTLVQRQMVFLPWGKKMKLKALKIDSDNA